MVALHSTVLAVPHNLEPVLVEGGDRICELLVLLVALDDIVDDSLNTLNEEHSEDFSFQSNTPKIAKVTYKE